MERHLVLHCLHVSRILVPFHDLEITFDTITQVYRHYTKFKQKIIHKMLTYTTEFQAVPPRTSKQWP